MCFDMPFQHSGVQVDKNYVNGIMAAKKYITRCKVAKIDFLPEVNLAVKAKKVNFKIDMMWKNYKRHVIS